MTWGAQRTCDRCGREFSSGLLRHQAACKLLGPCESCGKMFFKLEHREATRFCSSTCRHDARATHGETDSAEYRIWAGIKKRCSNPGAGMYHRYGGRGIKICDRWQGGFEAFLADMGRRPSPDHSIDRIDNDGNYEPGNCRWATRKEQARNRSQNIFVVYKGQRMCLMDACQAAGISEWVVQSRARRMGEETHVAFACLTEEYIPVRASFEVVEGKVREL